MIKNAPGTPERLDRNPYGAAAIVRNAKIESPGSKFVLHSKEVDLYISTSVNSTIEVKLVRNYLDDDIDDDLMEERDTFEILQVPVVMLETVFVTVMQYSEGLFELEEAWKNIGYLCKVINRQFDKL